MSANRSPESDTTLMRVRGLVKDFAVNGGVAAKSRKGTFRAVDGVNFDIVTGKTLAIVGESGSGKSTTARIVAKLLDPTSGALEFAGRDVSTVSKTELREFRDNVQVVFQDPLSSLNPRRTVEQINISALLRYQGIGDARQYSRIAKDLMARVGLNPDHSARYPSQFSGGQAQRVSTARAMIVDPLLVICGEAVSALDVTEAQVLELLRGLQREHGFSYLFIAHDLAAVRRIAHQVAVMSNGARDEVFNHPRDEYTKTLLSAIPRINPDWDKARRAYEREETE
jgi:ABC-type oligopeptide transport system ATPase subunit